MYTRITSAGLYGIDGSLVTVESGESRGLPTFEIVGLAGAQVKESRLRVKSAMEVYDLPHITRKMTVNLAPANFHKEGTHFDLPIALSVTASLGALNPSGCSDTAFFGELSLDGRLRAVNGILPLVLLCQSAGVRRVVVPMSNLKELSLVRGIEITACTTLKEVLDAIRNNFIYSRNYTGTIEAEPVSVEEDREDYRDVLGQEEAKRAMVISAAGGHGMLLMGSPGCGKSMLASRMTGILPPLTYEEKVETTKVFSVAGLLSEEVPFIDRRPFRTPHHSITQAALLGGGVHPKPGELSLAHNGVLFLDELGEFSQQVVDGLREPLERGYVTIARTTGAVTYPSDVILVAASNPCPCGYLGDPDKPCRCQPSEIRRYQTRLSGPLLDRIDLHIMVPRVPYKELGDQKDRSMDSLTMRRMVERARAIQERRFAGTEIGSNARIPPAMIDTYCPVDDKTREILEDAADRWHLSTRACHKVLRIARTIADVDGKEEIGINQISEAIRYRSALEVKS